MEVRQNRRPFGIINEELRHMTRHDGYVEGPIGQRCGGSFDPQSIGGTGLGTGSGQ